MRNGSGVEAAIGGKNECPWGAHVLLRRRVTDRDLLVPLITDRMTALAFSILAGAAALLLASSAADCCKQQSPSGRPVSTVPSRPG